VKGREVEDAVTVLEDLPLIAQTFSDLGIVEGALRPEPSA